MNEPRPDLRLQTFVFWSLLVIMLTVIGAIFAFGLALRFFPHGFGYG